MLSSRRVWPVALLVVAAAGAVLLPSFVWSFLRVYGDTNASGAWQGLGLVALPLVVVVVVLASAGGWFRKGVASWVAAAVIVVGGIVGVALAGQLAVGAKFATFTRTPNCLMVEPDDGKGSVDPRAAAAAARAQAVFDALSHPGPFGGTTESGVSGCAGVLATNDTDAVLASYRAEMAQKGWVIIADDSQPSTAPKEEPPAWRLAATKDRLTLEVEALSGGGGAATLIVRVSVPEEE